MIKELYGRIYSDFFMPSRLKEYHELLLLALRQGYEVHSVRSFWEVIKKGVNPDTRYLILRHDIDTSIDTAKKLFEMESGLGIRASYFFRLSAIDTAFMRKIEEAGGEASYHYEELSSFAKERRLKTKEEVYSHLEEIKSRFAANLTVLRKKTRLPMKIVASHGDFVNRRLKMPNSQILIDTALRNTLEIELEAYDSQMMGLVTARYSDSEYPKFWFPDNPEDSFIAGKKIIYILMHQRYWEVNIKDNFKDDMFRIAEGLKYYL
jgi:hypothetical protein